MCFFSPHCGFDCALLHFISQALEDIADDAVLDDEPTDAADATENTNGSIHVFAYSVFAFQFCVFTHQLHLVDEQPHVRFMTRTD